MKLLTHNMLTSHVKGVKNGYPLVVLAKQVIVNVVDFNADFIARMLRKVDWPVLRTTAQSVRSQRITNTSVVQWLIWVCHYCCLVLQS